jgi:hypothetical protein
VLLPWDAFVNLRCDPAAPPGVDTTTPSPARLYDYYLGGRNNFEMDRKAAEALRQSLPALSDAAWANRGFHQRAATWLARAGLRQFIDIGSGLPTAGNTHQVVQRVDPAARVVYADIDPMVAAQSAPPPLAVHAMLETYANATAQLVLRPGAAVERFFAGLELVPPYAGVVGLTWVGLWGAVDPAPADSDGSRVLYCGVARSP